MRHIMKGHLLYSKRTTLSINPIPKHLHRNYQNNICVYIHVGCYCGFGKLMKETRIRETHPEET